ncbi:MAG: histidinol-phosphatase [Caulobacterales bacterium]
MLSEDKIADYRAFADVLADAARAAILPYFRAPHVIENKKTDSYDPVTAADRAAEEKMRALIGAYFPAHGVLGEEFEAQKSEDGFTWIIDPIDGTRAFISGLPTWGVLIALAYEGEPVLGVIDQPYIGERFVGWSLEHSYGADFTTRDGTRPMHVRDCARLADARIATTDAALFHGDEALAFDNVRRAAQLTRYGYDCYAYAMAAQGGLDCVIESGLRAWDVAALMPVIEGAGGSLTDWAGHAIAHGDALLDPASRFQVLACGDARVRDEAIALLHQAAR